MILVTGASGLLGANVVLHLRDQGREVTATYHLQRLCVPGVRVEDADLSDVSAIRQLVQSVDPEWIIHCAAQTDVDWCEKYPEDAQRINAEASRNLAIAARRAGAGLVYISTDSVFDGESGSYNEDDSPNPINAYARSKLEGERAVMEELRGSVVVRTNIYGWNARNKLSLAEWMLERLRRAQEVPGFVDVQFTPILVNSLASILSEMIDRELSGLYHVTGSQSCSKHEFALRLADVYKLPRELVSEAHVSDPGFLAPRPRNTSLCTDKISHELGRSMPSLLGGLRAFRRLEQSGYVTRLRT